MAGTKIYLRCSAKQKMFPDGGSVINIDCKADELIAFATAHKNNAGYVNLIVSERREVGSYGDTHSVRLNDWRPQASSGGTAEPLPPVQRRVRPEDDEDPPF